MATIRNKFHELGNCHNKISLAAIVTKEALTEADLEKLSKDELKRVVEKSIKNLKKIEGFIIDADKTVDELKPFVYEKVGGDTEIPPPGK